MELPTGAQCIAAKCCQAKVLPQTAHLQAAFALRRSHMHTAALAYGKLPRRWRTVSVCTEAGGGTWKARDRASVLMVVLSSAGRKAQPAHSSSASGDRLRSQ